MVKKIRRFIVFCLYSFCFSLISGKEDFSVMKDKKDDAGSEKIWNSAEARMVCVFSDDSYRG